VAPTRPGHAPRVLIAGAGIGGIGVAAALQGNAWHVTLAERRQAWGHEGAGIALSPAGVRALEYLGCANEVRAKARRVDRVLVADSSGRGLGCLGLAESCRGLSTLAMPRAVLLESLHAAAKVPIRFGVELVTLREHPDCVEATFADGRHEAYDLVVGADGAHSRVRQAVCPETKIIDTKVRCWRFVMADQRNRRDVVEFLGPHRRLGLIPLPNNETYIFATADFNELRDRDDVGQDEFRRLFSNFGAPGLDIAHGEKRAFGVEDLTTLLRPFFGRGRVALLGDAAHLMTPSLAQGATLALEDAVVLASVLSAGLEPPTALQIYTNRRVDRVRRFAIAAEVAGRLAHARSPIVQRLRDAALRYGSGLGWALSSFLAWGMLD
jgi:2-heptyl-3-hydroxy-4(1H)-quinolone synthase